MFNRLIKWFNDVDAIIYGYHYYTPNTNALAKYNAEVSRGIMHTEEYKEKMEALQKAYDLSVRINAEAKGWKVI